MSLHVHINWPAWPLRLESFWLAWSQDIPAWVPTAGFPDGLLWPGVPEAIATTPFQVVKIRMQCLAETIKTKSSWHVVTCKRWKLEKYITKMRTRERKIINLIQSRPSLCSLVVAFQVEFHIILLHRYCVCWSKPHPRNKDLVKHYTNDIDCLVKAQFPRVVVFTTMVRP